MFDLITGRERHLPSHAAVPIIMSTAAQATVIALVVAVPMLFFAEQLPQIETMMAFVAAPPAPPPPPPPPPPAARAKQAPEKARPVPSENAFLAPVTEPSAITELPDDEGFDQGVPGGVEGGIPGGVLGGVVGGLPEATPPPPPPPAVERAPVRIGGKIDPPQLVRRVEPYYPPIAARAHIQGVVILEAIVDRDGNVSDVRLLRSANPLIDREAEIAVRQWRYSPLVLNGIRERFVLTVTLSFFLQPPK